MRIENNNLNLERTHSKIGEKKIERDGFRFEERVSDVPLLAMFFLSVNQTKKYLKS